jgi:prevent-host-death family protein
VTEFRANAAQFIEHVNDTREPVILTQHGPTAAVLLHAESYQSMLKELGLLRDVRIAEKDTAAGKGRTRASVAKTLRARLAG